MRFGRTNSRLAALDVLTVSIFPLLAFFTAPAARAASPSSGTIGPTSPAVTWNGTATGGVSASEATCSEGLNCDTFTLTVSGVPTDWIGKLVSIEIDWNNPLNDYDLYVHKDSNSGPVVARSTGGAPEITEHTTINPLTTGTGIYTVHVVYFSVTPLIDQYRGTILSINRPPSRVANYVKGGMTFSPNVRTKAPVAARDGEPSNRTDVLGNHYVTAIRGLPAGIDLWYFDLQPGSPTYDPNMRNPIYRGQPDSFTGSDLFSVGGDGGGDVDIAVGFGSPALPFSPGPPILASTSLIAANISTQRSTDRGATFAKNPAGSAPGVPVDDRQWIEFFGTNTVYLLYRTLAPAVTQIQRSNDGGLTYGLARTAGLIGQVGGISVDQSDGTVYVSGSTGMVCVGVPVAPGLEPLLYNCNQAVSDSNGVAHLFVIVKVAADGTAYVAYSNDRDIFLAHSTNKGQSWSLPVRVSDGPETLTSVFPALVTGPLPGSVGVAWYGTTEATNNDNANWQVFSPRASMPRTILQPSSRWWSAITLSMPATSLRAERLGMRIGTCLTTSKSRSIQWVRRSSTTRMTTTISTVTRT